MPTSAQNQTLLEAASSIRSAQGLLKKASYATTDVATLLKINTAHADLDSYLSHVLHAQTISDDALFSNTTTDLKQQSRALSADEAQIKAIVADVGLAAQIVGYIAQAIAVIGGL